MFSVQINRTFWILLVISWIASYPVRLLAHSPSDLILSFEVEDNELILRMHTTQQTAIDIIKNDRKDIKGNNLNLNSMASLFEDFFNETIDLKINGSPMEICIETMDLNRHDSFIKFGLSQSMPQVLSFSVNIACLDFYSNPSYHIELPMDDTILRKRLSKSRPFLSLTTTQF